MNDDFYIGYLDRFPTALRRGIRCTAVVGLLLAFMTAVLVALGQKRAETGVFEFGHPRTFAGEILELPFPILYLAGTNGGGTNFVLVGEGKRGVPAWFRGKHGHRVVFTGTLIQKESDCMIEVSSTPDPKDEGIEPVSPLVTHVFGPVALKGELVDTKCYFGVMRPGEGKVHRACAVRCLSGGVPPGLLVRDGDGRGQVLLLTGEEDWEPLQFDPQWAARMLSVSGVLERNGNLLILRVKKLSLID